MVFVVKKAYPNIFLNIYICIQVKCDPSFMQQSYDIVLLCVRQ